MTGSPPLPATRAAELETALERLRGEGGGSTASLVSEIDAAWDAWARAALALVGAEPTAEPDRVAAGREVLRELRALALLRGEVLALAAARRSGPSRP